MKKIFQLADFSSPSKVLQRCVSSVAASDPLHHDEVCVFRAYSGDAVQARGAQTT